MAGVIDFTPTVSPDEWAGGCKATLTSRAALRAKLARDMAAYEAKHGKVEPTPIVPRDGVETGKAPLKKKQLTPLLQDTLSALRKGHDSIDKIAKLLNIPHGNIHYALKQLSARGLAERVSRGVYRALEDKSHG